MVETRFQTSFIPKKPVTPGVAYRGDGQGMGFLAIIALILVIVATLASVGAFLYTQFLNSNIDRIEDDLVTVKASLDQTALDLFQSLGAKTAIAESLLKNHTAFSQVTSFLGGSTLKNVRFKDLAFEASPGGEGALVLKGEAQSYSALASQVSNFKNNTNVSSVSVSGLVLDDKGNVSFEVKLKLSSDLFAYVKTQDSLSFRGVR